MNWSFLDKGLLTEDQLKKISYLATSREEKEINALLTKYTRGLKIFLKYSFLSDFFGAASFLIILSIAPLLINLDKVIILITAATFFVFQIGSVILKQIKDHYLLNYSRAINDLGDKLFSSIFEDYKLSLEKSTPDFPFLKELFNSISESGSALKEYLDFISGFSAYIFSLLVVFILLISTNFILYKHLFIEIFFILIAFLIMLILASIKSLYEKEYSKNKEINERTFIATQPLLFRSSISFDENSYINKSRYLNMVSNNILLIENIIVYLLPIMIFFFALFNFNFLNVMLLLVAGFYMTSKLQIIKNAVKNGDLVAKGIQKLDQIDSYLNNILNEGAEISPNIYKKFQNDYIKTHPETKITDRIVWGDLNIEGLEYTTGRDKDMKYIYGDNLSLPYGKVSLMVGSYGIGKTLFGRLITLRYSNFSSDSISIGNKDIRTFKSLDSGLRYLHLSGDRSISTSYRNALSAYLKEKNSMNMFMKKVFSLDNNIQQILNYFEKNDKYYANVNRTLLPVLRASDILLSKDDMTDENLNLISELFQNFSYIKPFSTVYSKFKNYLDESVLKKALMYAAFAEFIAYDHLKSYMQESTIYFMDMDLSKPPVHQELKLRFLYAIDIFMEGLVFVIDEPFSNLNMESASKVFQDLVEYARNYNAVVLIIDEEINQDVIDLYKGKGVLGKILRFEDDGFVMNIKENDIDITQKTPQLSQPYSRQDH